MSKPMLMAGQTDAAGEPSRGLTAAEVARRLADVGPNAVIEPPRRPLQAFLGHFWAPVPWMLEAAILLQAMLGEYVEAAVIAALLVFNAVLASLQNERAQSALAALKSKLALTASVRRDGTWLTILAQDIVPGDIVKLTLGAIVPADARLVSGAVQLDQSMLTGETAFVEAGPGRAADAGAIVRRGEAVAEVTATGARTFSGRAAELVRTAHVESAEQRAILGVVRNLAVLNGFVLVLMVGYAHAQGMVLAHVITLVLTAVLASVPVALPATFTLAAALGAKRLIGEGVLPTRLSAVEEAATMDVLCSDKTGTLTQNTLEVVEVKAAAGFEDGELMALAALASAEGGADPLDAAIRAAARGSDLSGFRLVRFTPFDPAVKIAEAEVATASGSWRVVKGAFAVVAAEAPPPQAMIAAMQESAAAGNRVLGVAAGPADGLRFAGLIALSDPPRADSAPLIAELGSLGINTVMVTGDAAITAAALAKRIGLAGAVNGGRTIPERVTPQGYGVFAGVLPEDKFRLVKAFQKTGHTVGMCGDGANDAPALRQAQIGIAVASATDAAKGAAGMVLTQPGLGGIVAAIKEGRSTFRRILTYTLNAVIKKVETVPFLGVGLLVTGHSVLTPLLMVILLVTNDFLSMSLTTDRAEPSAKPERWRIGAVTAAAVALGLVKLCYSSAVLLIGHYSLGYDIEMLRTLAFVTLAFGSQTTIYAIRDPRRILSSRPGPWIVFSSLIDIVLASVIALWGGLTAPLPVGVLVAVLASSILFALLLDAVKVPIFGRLGLA
jgi:H+-transporting ATPase